MLKKYFFCALLCNVGVFSYADDPPVWPKQYRITGTIRLPYAEINEPFEAWFDEPNARSRVDYYQGVVSTIQIGGSNKTGYGLNYKIAPAFIANKNVERCFLVNGTKDAPATIQTVLPDTANFKKIGPSNIFNQSAVLWQMVDYKYKKKKNVYSLWLTPSGQPLRYEMMGFDTLLGSHYDKYYVDYDMIRKPKNFSDDTFKPKAGLECGDFPGPGAATNHILVNPMKEYINQYDEHTDEMFDHFKRRHGKHYASGNEHDKRKHLFRQNHRFINSKNRAGLTYSLSVNHLADLTDVELKSMRGYRHMTDFDPDAIVFDKTEFDLKSVPDQFDWRLYGAVNPVKDQAVCGSCWSFGTTGTIEGAYYLMTGQLVRFSQQELMDCSWDKGNNACDGGEDYRAYWWIKENGLAKEEDYGPYLSQDGICHFKNVSVDNRVYLTGYVNVTANDTEALKVAIFNKGPVSVGIDASQKSLSFYANGIYMEPKCGSGPDSLDHAVLAVGYGVINGQAYWLIKNSWSTYWGNDGYVLMGQSMNQCGVETAPTYPVIKKPKSPSV